MRCPYCHYPESRVLDTRLVQEGSEVRRRRICDQCAMRFTTYERMQRAPLVTIKKDGRREPFSREKLLAGMSKACQKRPVPMDRIENEVELIEQECRSRFEKEVPSQFIGEEVMERLKRLDQVAYVRFASVYREFQDVWTFMDEIKKLRAGEPGRPRRKQAKLES